MGYLQILTEDVQLLRSPSSLLTMSASLIPTHFSHLSVPFLSLFHQSNAKEAYYKLLRAFQFNWNKNLLIARQRWWQLACVQCAFNEYVTTMRRRTYIFSQLSMKQQGIRARSLYKTCSILFSGGDCVNHRDLLRLSYKGHRWVPPPHDLVAAELLKCMNRLLPCLRRGIERLRSAVKSTHSHH